MVSIKWSTKASSDFEHWQRINPKLAQRIEDLIENIKQTPYSGKGKPELLKYNLAGFWSRRVDKENRLVYRVEKGSIIIYIESCKGHYAN